MFYYECSFLLNVGFHLFDHHDRLRSCLDAASVDHVELTLAQVMPCYGFHLAIN